MSRTLKVELEVITDKASKSVAKSLTEGVRSALEGLRQISFESFFQDLKIKPVMDQESEVRSQELGVRSQELGISTNSSVLTPNPSKTNPSVLTPNHSKTNHSVPTPDHSVLTPKPFIDKAWSAPRSNKGRYFLQDGAKPDTTIDEHILSEEKEMNKTLDEISTTLKNSRGAVW